MPLFFFHVYDDDITLDDEGLELADARAARDLAVRAARDLASSEVLKGALDLGHRIEVRDQAGAAVADITFADAILAPR